MLQHTICMYSTNFPYLLTYFIDTTQKTRNNKRRIVYGVLIWKRVNELQSNCRSLFNYHSYFYPFLSRFFHIILLRFSTQPNRLSAFLCIQIILLKSHIGWLAAIVQKSVEYSFWLSSRMIFRKYTPKNVFRMRWRKWFISFYCSKLQIKLRHKFQLFQNERSFNSY